MNPTGARGTKWERELLAILRRPGNDVECSLSRGLAIVHYSGVSHRASLVTRLGDADRKILARLLKRGWLAAHSETDDGMLFGLTKAGR